MCLVTLEYNSSALVNKAITICKKCLFPPEREAVDTPVQLSLAALELLSSLAKLQFDNFSEFFFTHPSPPSSPSPYPHPFPLPSPSNFLPFCRISSLLLFSPNPEHIVL